MNAGEPDEENPLQVYHAQFSPLMNTSALIEAIAAGLESVGWTKLTSSQYWQTTQIDVLTTGVPEDTIVWSLPKSPTATTPQLKFLGPVPGGYFSSVHDPDPVLMAQTWPHIDGLTPVAFPGEGEGLIAAESMIAMVFPGWNMSLLRRDPFPWYRMWINSLGTAYNDIAFSGGQWFASDTPFSYGGGYRMRSAAANGKTQYDIALRTNAKRGLQIEFIGTYGGDQRAIYGMDIGDNFTYQNDVKWTSTLTWKTYYGPDQPAHYLVGPITVIANPYQLLIFDANTVDRRYDPTGLGGNSFLCSAPYVREYEEDRFPTMIDYCAFAVGPGLMKDGLTFYDGANAVTVTAAVNGNFHSYRPTPYLQQSSGHVLPLVENGRGMSTLNGLPPEWNAWALLSPSPGAEARICGQLWDAYLAQKRFDYRSQVARRRSDTEMDLFTCVSSASGQSAWGGNQGSLFVRHQNLITETT